MKIRAVLVTLCLSRIAAAGELTLDRTCVEIDADDGLAPADRTRATDLMRRALEREDLLVVATGCTETYALSHERVGTAYVIHVRSSAGKRRMTTPALDELSPKYQKLVRSLINAKAVLRSPPEPLQVPEDSAPQGAPEPQVAAAELHTPSEPLGTPDSEDVPSEPPLASPYKRNLWYATLGAQLTGGAGWSFGFRHSFGTTSVDFALAIRDSDGGSNATTFGVEVLRTKPLSPTVRGYLGGGLSAGSTSSGSREYYGYGAPDYYWGEGIHGELTGGLHFGRGRGVQFLTQLDITLPFYRMGNDQGSHDYAALAVLSGGIGF